jgi:hypothetical protein
MASTSQDGRAFERDAAPERSVGEHIFIWIAWALAAAFWGATLTTMVQIFRTVGQTTPGAGAPGAPGAPGGTAYLVMVIVAFLVMAGALAYAEFRSAGSRAGGRREAATAALYNSIERQGGEDMTARSPRRRNSEQEFR